MAENAVDLIFRGELVPGADVAQVKLNLARLFKMDPARIEKLFAGNAVVLKKGMSLDAAAKYRIAIKKAGARVDTRLSAPPKREEPSTAASTGPTRTAPVTSAVKAEAPMGANKPAPSQSHAGLSLAPQGGDLLHAEEKTPEVQKAVDTSSLSLRPPGESLVDSSELRRPEPVSVATVAIDLAPPGEDVLKPEERRQVPRVELDLSAYSLSPPGERLQSASEATAPAPDVSGLSLV